MANLIISTAMKWWKTDLISVFFYTSLDIKSKNQTNNQYTYPLDFKFCPPYKDKAITLTNSDIRMKVYPQPGDTFFNVDQEGSKAVFDPTINTDWRMLQSALASITAL